MQASPLRQEALGPHNVFVFKDSLGQYTIQNDFAFPLRIEQ